MKKKNGFFSMTILFTLFFIFMLLLTLTIAIYINNRRTLSTFKTDIKYTLNDSSYKTVAHLMNTLATNNCTNNSLCINNSDTLIRYYYKTDTTTSNPNNYIYYNCTDTSNTATCTKYRILGYLKTIGSSSGVIKVVTIANYSSSVNIYSTGDIILEIDDQNLVYDGTGTRKNPYVIGGSGVSSVSVDAGEDTTSSDSSSTSYSSSPSVLLNSYISSLTIADDVYTDTHGSYTNYRYVGANPNNYVSFNGELWRIIGVFDTDSTGSSEKLVKIMRNTNVEIVYDSNNKNNWETASLNAIFQSYYNGESTVFSTLGSDAKSKIEKVKWSLGGYSTIGTSGVNAYAYERGTDVYAGNPTSWEGYVGLIYASDYVYSQIDSSTGDRDTCINKNNNSENYCYNNTWLYYFDSSSSVPVYKWTFTIDSGNDHMVCYSNLGQITTNITASMNGKMSANPTVYLKASVMKTGGTGTATDPYILG